MEVFHEGADAGSLLTSAVSDDLRSLPGP